MIPDLEREGLIRRIPADKKRVEDLLALAHRDLATSRTLLASSHDWAYTVAYNAVLQAGRALMSAHGYRPDGSNQHISVVKFAALYLEEKDVVVFDRMRRKRNSTVYDASGSVSETEAEFAVEQAEHLTRVIESLLDAA